MRSARQKAGQITLFSSLALLLEFLVQTEHGGLVWLAIGMSDEPGLRFRVRAVFVRPKQFQLPGPFRFRFMLLHLQFFVWENLRTKADEMNDRIIGKQRIPMGNPVLQAQVVPYAQRLEPASLPILD